MPKKTAAQLDAEIAEALRRPPSEIVDALRAAQMARGLKETRCKRCRGRGYIYTTRQEACPDCDKLGKVMARATKTTKTSGGYYVGAELRDDLVREIDALGWEGLDTDGVPFADRAQKIKSALERAQPQRKGYVIDVDGWTWQDYDFLKTTLDAVAEDMGHSASSRGISLGGTVVGRQIRALREKL